MNKGKLCNLLTYLYQKPSSIDVFVYLDISECKSKIRRKNAAYLEELHRISQPASHLQREPTRQAKPTGRRMSLDFPRGTVNLIGGGLDVDEPRLRTIGTSQSLHHCSVGYHLCHMDHLAKKAYPCKCNQEHKNEQEMISNKLGYEMGSHKSMNGDTVQ
jgi:hypothetical protein